MNFQKLARWVATCSMLLGAVIISLFPSTNDKSWVFVFFLVPHIIWSAISLQIKERELFLMNFLFLPIDLYAIFIRA